MLILCTDCVICVYAETQIIMGIVKYYNVHTNTIAYIKVYIL